MWQGTQPPGAADGQSWDDFLRLAPGFAAWHARLCERLATWGVVVDLPATDALKPIWLADWAAERWGTAAGERAAVAHDTWVQEALSLLGVAAARLDRAATSPAR